MIEYPTTCECETAGYCKRYQRDMIPGSWRLCQTRQDYRKSFYRRWALPTVPEELKPVQPPPPPNGPGEMMKWLIAKVTDREPTEGCGCEGVKLWMNSVGWGGFLWKKGAKDNRAKVCEYLKAQAAKVGVQCEPNLWSLMKAAFKEWRGSKAI